jgi:hypothetical protein
LVSTIRVRIYRRNHWQWSHAYHRDVDQYYEYGTNGNLYRNTAFGKLYRRHLYSDNHIESDAINNGNDCHPMQRGRIYSNANRRNEWDSTLRDDL